MNMIQSGIQLSSLGQNRDPMPATKHHDLNDRKQLELMERTGYEIVQRNGMYIFVRITSIGCTLKIMNIFVTTEKMYSQFEYISTTTVNMY